MDQVASPSADPCLAWWRGAVLYQVYLRSFQDGNGDGIGDLPGLLQRLPYLAELGVDGLWIGPFYPSPMRDFGYDVTDFCAVDPRFGTLEDLDAVIRRAHALGLKVLIDQVWSHTATEHPWFLESRSSRDNPKADWYVWADPRPDGTPPTNWLSWMGGPAWRWEPRRAQYHLHNFLPQMPDLNFHCAAVQEALLQVADFWWQRGVDGFRLDTANLYAHDLQLRDQPPLPADRRGPSPVLMQDPCFTMNQPESLAFARRLRQRADRAGNRVLVGELGGPDAAATLRTYTQGSERLHTAYSFAFLGARPAAEDIAALIDGWEDGEGWPSWAFSNHDVPRVASRWGGVGPTGFALGGPAASAEPAAALAPGSRSGPQPAAETPAPGQDPRLWLGLLLALRGTVFLYQGEELGLTQSEVPPEHMQDPYGLANAPLVVGRDGCRTPMPWSAQGHQAGFTTGDPWLPLEPAHRALAVDLQVGCPDSVWECTRSLLQLRRSHAALRSGRSRVLWTGQDCLALLRWSVDSAVLCLFHWGRGTVHCQGTLGVLDPGPPLACEPSQPQAPQRPASPLWKLGPVTEVAIEAARAIPPGAGRSPVDLCLGPGAAVIWAVDPAAWAEGRIPVDFTVETTT